MGFALIWHIWWLVILGFLGAWATFVVFAWRDDNEYEIHSEELERRDRERRQAKAKLLGIGEEAVA
jgi:cytochrome o ubiquinol oxidase subunit 1